MQFFIPIPWPLALFLLPFFLMARGVIWLARRALPYFLYFAGWLWGYHKTKFLMLRERIKERREVRRRMEQAKRDFEKVEREVQQYAAGRVIDGEARRLEDAENN